MFCIFISSKIIVHETSPGEIYNFMEIGNKWGLFYYIPMYSMIFISFIYIFYIQKKINKRLFIANGYVAEYKWFWQKKPEKYPPRVKLNIFLLVLLPLVAIITEVLFGLISYGIAVAIANMVS